MHRLVERLALCVLALVACTPDIPDPIWRGEHLHYGTTTSGPVCRGSFHRQEQHAVELARLLGFELSEVIHFTRIRRRQMRKYCGHSGQKVGGCAWEDAPYAFRAGTSYDYHEITHVVALLDDIQGPRLFAEGLAEVFEDGAERFLSGSPLDELLNGEVEGPGDYFTAGRFVRFLIERYDLLTLAEFMRVTGREDTIAEYGPVFAEVFGESIEAVIADFAGYPACSSVSNEIAVIDCNLPLQRWNGASLTVTANVACDQDDVLGPDGVDMMHTTRGFAVEEAGTYRLSPADPSGLSTYRLVKCGSCWDSLEVPLTAGVAESHELTPGRYHVRFGRRVSEPAELTLLVDRL